MQFYIKQLEIIHLYIENYVSSAIVSIASPINATVSPTRSSYPDNCSKTVVRIDNYLKARTNILRAIGLGLGLESVNKINILRQPHVEFFFEQLSI